MKGFRDTSRTMVGHKASPMYKATGGTINRLAQGGHFGHMNRVAGIESQAEGKVEGLTGHGPSNNGNSAVMRSPVQPTEELKDHGGKTPLTAGYAAGGKPKVFHAHNHYHNGKKMPGKKALRKMEMQAEKKATGGTINKVATGGTINPVKKGGSMHINPAHKGKFTKKMTGSKHGKLTSKDVSKGLHSESGETRKEANFARMARRGFKPLDKADGGHVPRPGMTPPDYATGGTINPRAAGGALYKRGGKAC